MVKVAVASLSTDISGEQGQLTESAREMLQLADIAWEEQRATIGRQGVSNRLARLGALLRSSGHQVMSVGL